jgi:alcohol dehydrogenase (cytochrome c)
LTRARSPPILVDYQRGGRTAKGLIDVGRDGYMWFLDRGDATTGGRIHFIEGKPFVYQNVYTKLDPETGKPTGRPGPQARYRERSGFLAQSAWRQELAADRFQSEDAHDLCAGEQ